MSFNYRNSLVDIKHLSLFSNNVVQSNSEFYSINLDYGKYSKKYTIKRNKFRHPLHLILTSNNEIGYARKSRIHQRLKFYDMPYLNILSVDTNSLFISSLADLDSSLDHSDISNTLSNHERKREMARYYSHISALKQITMLNMDDLEDGVIILEDDCLLINNYNVFITDILNKTEKDIIILGSDNDLEKIYGYWISSKYVQLLLSPEAESSIVESSSVGSPEAGSFFLKEKLLQGKHQIYDINLMIEEYVDSNFSSSEEVKLKHEKNHKNYYYPDYQVADYQVIEDQD